MQHPVCSQRRSSPPSIHPAIKTLNSINLRPVAQSGSASRGPVLCSTQHLAPSIQHHGGSSGPPPLPKKTTAARPSVLSTTRGPTCLSTERPKLNPEMRNAHL